MWHELSITSITHTHAFHRIHQQCSPIPNKVPFHQENVPAQRTSTFSTSPTATLMFLPHQHVQFFEQYPGVHRKHGYGDRVEMRTRFFPPKDTRLSMLTPDGSTNESRPDVEGLPVDTPETTPTLTQSFDVPLRCATPIQDGGQRNDLPQRVQIVRWMGMEMQR